MPYMERTTPSHQTVPLTALSAHDGDFLLQTCDLVLSVSNPDQLSSCSFSLLPDNSNPMRTCDITTPGDEEFTLEPKNEAFSLDDSVEMASDKEMYVKLELIPCPCSSRSFLICVMCLQVAFFQPWK